MLNCLFLASRPGRPKKASKMTSGSLPGPSPRVGKSTNNGPKTRQKGSKTVPRALNTTFHLPLSHPERPPEADLAPTTPQEGSRSPFGTPGWRNLTPGGGHLTPLASKMLVFAHGVPGRVDSFVELIFHRCLLRVPSEICLLRALREKGAFGLRPTKTNGISCFLYMRGAAGHAARKATKDNI